VITDGQSTSIAANTTTNVFIGRPLEFIGVASVLRLLLSADAAGLQSQLLLNVGGDQRVPLAAGTPIPVASAAGAGPKDDEDTVCPQVPVPPGARLQLNVTNTTGGAIVVRYRGILAP
jgi:hypothetical protein